MRTSFFHSLRVETKRLNVFDAAGETEIAEGKDEATRDAAELNSCSYRVYYQMSDPEKGCKSGAKTYPRWRKSLVGEVLLKHAQNDVRLEHVTCRREEHASVPESRRNTFILLVKCISADDDPRY